MAKPKTTKAERQRNDDLKAMHDRALRWLNAHPTLESVDPEQAGYEHWTWIKNEARTVVNALPSLRSFMSGLAPVAVVAAREIAATLKQGDYSEREHAEIAATAMYMLCTEIS